MARVVVVLGASGNVGKHVVRLLTGREGVQLVAPTRAELDLEKPTTEALDAVFGRDRDHGRGVSSWFLLRPPSMSDAKMLEPTLDAAKRHGAGRVVFLSVLGAGGNPFLPHRVAEKLIEERGMTHTFLRPSYFMQNLSTTHAREIKSTSGEILVPAGGGATSFIDSNDVAEVAVKALLGEDNAAPSENRIYDLTGPEAITYAQVAAVMSEELGRPIRYDSPGIIRFVREMHARGEPWGYIGVMVGIYTACRLGWAARVTDETERLLGRKPTTFREFVRANKAVWDPSPEYVPYA